MKTLPLFKLHLTGHSLVYTLLLTLLVSGLLSAYLLSEHAIGITAERHWNELSASDQAKSQLLQWLFSAGAEEGQENLGWEHWGLFGLYTNETLVGQKVKKVQGLIGQKPDLIGQSSLWLADSGLPLTLGGTSELVGELYLPQGGIKTTLIDGAVFSGRYSSNNHWHPSHDQRLPINQEILAPVRKRLDSLTSLGERPSLTYWQDLQYAQPWDSSTLILRATGELVLDGVQLSGRIIVIASHSIYLKKSNQLTHIQLIAPNIYIENGFQGTLQAFASDTLEVSAHVKLLYPSVLAVFAKPERSGFLSIDQYCEVEGSILYLSPTEPSVHSLRPQVQIGTHTHIWGSMHVAGNLSLRGTVSGHVATKSFVLLTRVGVYQNHLLDACIRSDRRAPAYAGPLFYSSNDYELLFVFSESTQTDDAET